ncbi:hypothetical protein C1Y63_11425 [Corynebacterium sp. 13CS0277]|uniref:hypothetical protein n=1 Tax=Corynebacterium sp. 13CS0277 TaxID=2071994 RepID=UPI000D0345E5|nr:hypothetical protein [Corynebacterium sp. 13CS0277]PRQ10445.1 hypothetical protein C1Y63_11425 [Corynebacterium sp. 13CS0277]
MADDIELMRQTLEEAYKAIDQDHYPATTAFIRHLIMISEDSLVVNGQIDTNRLALALITIISLQEQRVNKLEEIISKHINCE